MMEQIARATLDRAALSLKSLVMVGKTSREYWKITGLAQQRAIQDDGAADGHGCADEPLAVISDDRKPRSCESE